MCVCITVCNQLIRYVISSAIHKRNITIRRNRQFLEGKCTCRCRFYLIRETMRASGRDERRLWVRREEGGAGESSKREKTPRAAGYPVLSTLIDKNNIVILMTQYTFMYVTSTFSLGLDASVAITSLVATIPERLSRTSIEGDERIAVLSRRLSLGSSQETVRKKCDRSA